jgi:ribosomal protein S4E
MLQNLTNFFNLIASRRISTTANADDLITLGVRDPRTPGIYQPTAIKVSDLLAGEGVNQVIAGSGISISPTGGTGVVTITNTGGLPSFLEYNATNKTVWNNGQGNISTNTSFGESALISITSGNQNTAYGDSALRSNTGGSNNTVIGYEALRYSTTQSNVVAIGWRANGISSPAPFSGGVAIGYEAGFSGNSFGVAVGYQAGRAGSTANGIAIGSNALQNMTGGQNIIAIGPYAMGNGSGTTFLNTGIGWAALLNAGVSGTGVSYNVAIGYEAMRSATSSSQQNVTLGNGTLRNMTSGSFNTAIGDNALYSNTTGSNNVVVGQSGAYFNTTGSNNIAIGRGAATGNFSGSIIIGQSATATANNQFVVGSTTQAAGTVTTESLASTQTWSVIINGVAYKILLA